MASPSHFSEQQKKGIDVPKQGGRSIPSRNAIPDAVLTEAVAWLDYIGIKTEHLRSVRSATSVSSAMKDALQDQMMLMAEEAGESLIKAVAEDLPVIKTIVAASQKVMERFRARLAIPLVQRKTLPCSPEGLLMVVSKW